MPFILLAEPDDLVASTLQDALEGAGYEVKRAADGQTALRYLPAASMLITDLALRGGWATEVIEAAHQWKIPVIISTGTVDPTLRTGLRMLTKPFRLSELLAVVRDVLDTE